MKHVATYQGHFFTEPKYFRPHCILYRTYFVRISCGYTYSYFTCLYLPSSPNVWRENPLWNVSESYAMIFRSGIGNVRNQSIHSFLLPCFQGVPRARQQRRRRLRHLVRGQGQDVPRTGNITKQHILLRTVYRESLKNASQVVRIMGEKLRFPACSR